MRAPAHTANGDSAGPSQYDHDGPSPAGGDEWLVGRTRRGLMRVVRFRIN